MFFKKGLDLSLNLKFPFDLNPLNQITKSKTKVFLFFFPFWPEYYSFLVQINIGLIYFLFSPVAQPAQLSPLRSLSPTSQ
jgi:hypothetical protein